MLGSLSPVVFEHEQPVVPATDPIGLSRERDGVLELAGIGDDFRAGEGVEKYLKTRHRKSAPLREERVFTELSLSIEREHVNTPLTRTFANGEQQKCSRLPNMASDQGK